MSTELDEQKSHLVCEGKTKIVRTLDGAQDLVLIESKNDITTFDDPARQNSSEPKQSMQQIQLAASLAF